MIRVYTLEGLECANCAAKIERNIKKIEGISDVSLNLINTTLKFDVGEEFSGDIYQAVSKIVHKYEPDVSVLEKRDDKGEISAKTGKSKAAWLIIGSSLFVIGMIFEHAFSFALSEYIAIGLFAVSYFLVGTKVLVRMIRNILKGQIFDENFLMGVATLGAIGIGEYSGATAVMVFYMIGEFFQEMAVAKSKKNISELMDIRPDYANLLINLSINEYKKVDPQSVKIGDIILIKPGEKIPLDGIVVEGEAMLNMAALTGESIPRKAGKGDQVLSGSVNQNGLLTIEVTKTFGESTVSKIIDLVENAASRKAKVETFITKFARYYTPVVMALALLIATVPPLFFGGLWADWVYRSLVLLIIACPCALVMSIPLGFFGGIGSASKKGVLVKGGNFLEALADMDIIVFDKTGTLTKGVFKVTGIKNEPGFREEQVLEAAAYAEAFSNHPIALSILDEYGERNEREVNKDSLSAYTEIAGHGVSVNSMGQTILAGNEKLMKIKNISFKESDDFGTKVYIALDNKYAGCILISDEIKNDSKNAISAMKGLGVRKTVMLTGDSSEVANAVAAELKIDEVYSSLLPQDKVEKLDALRSQRQARKSLAFVGDGINDAPVLALADVGIAMGALGSDAAIEAADVVLMTDEPSKLIDAVKVARYTKKIIWQNIIFALGVQFLFLVLGSMGVASIWEAIFADVGVSLLAVLNTWRILKI
ncbi:MAG: cadmium-translocating P-type ATPase [Treponema sp.]|nr:cadmium-translocating P-type ATPase [Treponema sp.]